MNPINNNAYQIRHRTPLVNLFITVVSLLLFALSPNLLAAESYAIFSLNNDFKQLSKSKARMLFRGKAKSLQGKRIELSDWPSNTENRQAFYQMLLGKDQAQMNAYWAGLSFSGKARPPKEMKSASIEELLQWLAQKDTRIGYAPLDALPDHVNVLYVIKKEKQ